MSGSFWTQFEGASDGIIQNIDTLKNARGETVVTQLVHDFVGDGRVGDVEREGAEEAINSNSMKTTIDLISQQTKNTGKLSDQKSVLNFREEANNNLSYWLANRQDQLKFLTLSGISYDMNTNGSVRDSDEFSKLAFAGDVTPPSANRYLRVDGDTVATDDNSNLTATDTLTYGALVDACAYAEENYIKRINEGGNGYYCIVMHPTAYAQLKKSADFQAAVIQGMPRSEKNPWFTGAIMTVDGLAIKTHRLSYNTRGAADGSKWGASGDVDGNRALILGSQAMVQANVSDVSWVEKKFQYDSFYGISVDKMFGLRKSVYETIYNTDANGNPLVEDFGTLVLDTAMGGVA